MSVLRWLVLLGVVGTLIVAVPAAIMVQETWDRVRSAPVDVSQVRQRLGFDPPKSLIAFVKRDSLAYHAHATLAGLIVRSNGDPAAIGVQWVKAAAHARTDDDLVQVTRGLAWALEQSKSPESIQPTLCSYVEGGYWTGRQREAFQAAGIRCTHGRHW